MYAGDPDATGKPTSFGDFQLHYPGVGRNTADGLGTKFTRETGLDARDPNTWKEQIDFAMKEAAKRGWGDWHGAARAGIGNRQGIGTVPQDQRGPAPASSSQKPGWIDKDTYTDGINIFKRGADGHMSRATNIPGQPATFTSRVQEYAARAGDAMNRLDMDKFKGIGAATQGFNPSEYLKTAPPVGSTSSSTDNSVRNQTFNGGPTHVTINTHGDVRETAEVWRRHGERQKADDLRYAASVFA